MSKDIQSRHEFDPEEWYLTSGIGWQLYEALLATIRELTSDRVTNLDEILDIMFPNRPHEGEKTRIATLLDVSFEQTNYYTHHEPKTS